jgi:hypothetical protein
MTYKKKLQEFQRKQDEANFSANLNRARSVTVGTCFGGTTELMMRGNDGSVLWTPMQPVEVIELIHQLAANVGCHIALKPREDFASWREWKIAPHMYAGNGWPPFVNDMAPHQHIGQNLPAPEQQPGLQPALMARSNENEQTLATQKTVGRKRTKRAAAAA